jgi:DNA-binding HxlR family transcriptional regulator
MADHTDPPDEHDCNASHDASDILPINDVIRGTLAAFTGKWKLEILWLLGKRVHRFNELRRALPGITQHMLTAQLRDLERDGMVRRTLYPEVPPRVEYAVTDKARALRPVIREIFAWAHATRAE